jgi:hypothetical protein
LLKTKANFLLNKQKENYVKMAQKTTKTRIQQKRELEADWLKATSFVPLAGELIVYLAESDTDELPTGRTTPYKYPRFKVGDGVTTVTNLPFSHDGTVGAYYVEGAGTTDSTAKTSTWTGTIDPNIVKEYYDGLTIRYKIGVAGQSTVTLNINNLGAKTVYRFSDTKLTTHFPVGSIIHLIYHADLNGGCWITNDYDANTNTQQRLYPTTTNKEYPITARYNTSTGSSYYAEYGRYSTGVTLNPSTNAITATTFKGDLDGNADTATKLATARTISITGDVSGSTSFDGSGNVSITATVADDSHNHVIANVDGLQNKLDALDAGLASANSHTLSKGTDSTATKTLSFGGTFTAVTDTAVDGHKITDTTTTYTLPSDRLFTTLIPSGTSIPANANLKTTTYLKVGKYYCSKTADAATLKNCPLSTAFMMEVYNPLSTTIDNETTGTWVYRLRKMTAYNTGVQYIQYCYVGGTANSWSYGDWFVVPRSGFTMDTTDTNGGSAALGDATHPVYVDSTGTLQACNAFAGATHGHTTTTGNAAPHTHTHTIKVSGTTGANSGTAVNAVTGYSSFSGGAGSLTSDTTATNGIKYVDTQGTFSAGTTPVSSAAPAHTSTNSGSSSGTSGTIASYSAGVLTIASTVNSGSHTHTYDKTTSITLTRGTAPSLGAATAKYLHHTHTGAALGTPSTTAVAPNSHTHSYGSSTALTTSDNSGSAVVAITSIGTPN